VLEEKPFPGLPSQELLTINAAVPDCTKRITFVEAAVSEPEVPGDRDRNAIPGLESTSLHMKFIERLFVLMTATVV
jgi:hypothetical protein